MRPIALAAAALFLCNAAWAGQPAASASPTAGPTASPTVVAAAAADKVYPPLPTLAMLPPASGDDDEAPAPHTASHKKKEKARQRDCHCAMPAPRLVVSDTSRAYLKDIEQRLDSALAQ